MTSLTVMHTIASYTKRVSITSSEPLSGDTRRADSHPGKAEGHVPSPGSREGVWVYDMSGNERRMDRQTDRHNRAVWTAKGPGARDMGCVCMRACKRKKKMMHA